MRPPVYQAPSGIQAQGSGGQPSSPFDSSSSQPHPGSNQARSPHWLQLSSTCRPAL